MALLSIKNLEIAFGGPSLFSNVDLHVEKGERLALLGRNGVGKSTLFRIISGEIKPDVGNVVFTGGTRVAVLPQDVPTDISGTIYEFVSKSANIDEWDSQNKVDEAISRMKLEPQAELSKLSGGQKRRAFLAAALVKEPDVLLLDEPTNHLDLESIIWLENFLLKLNAVIIFISHDRSFSDKIATRVIELERGGILNWNCPYNKFLEKKEAWLVEEERHWKTEDKKLASEEVWIRKGIKARRTRNEGRVKALFKLREDRKGRRDRIGSAKLELNKGALSGRNVIKANKISFAYPESEILVKNFTTAIMRGDKIAVMGPNGSGKTTLLKLLLGELEPSSGTVKTGTNLDVIYFDQLRSFLDEDKTIVENLCGKEGQTVTINGHSIHASGYLQRFLFNPDRLQSPVKALSGGERNRLLFAKLFAQPSNFIVMDEPTNDLDGDTLELLEELLAEFDGTLILVSHDRTFINNVATSTIVLEKDGAVGEYAGGYDDWLIQRKNPEDSKPKFKEKKEIKKSKSTSVVGLGYMEKRELEALPEKLQTLEEEQEEIHKQMADPAIYKENLEKVTTLKNRLDELEIELSTAYDRWEELEDKKNS